MPRTPLPSSRMSAPLIAVLGRRQNTANYERFLTEHHFRALVTLHPEDTCCCDGLLLPGGGDITPAFFGEKNKGSMNIDTELDILQFQALELCIFQKKPVLGICKGMQLINIAFGGTLVQDMPNRHLHLSRRKDLYHPVNTVDHCILQKFYGSCPEQVCVNSAHHQCLHTLGQNLDVIQTCCFDHCPEAISHRTLPILGIQWHPERLSPQHTTLSGAPLLSIFLSEQTEF